MRPTHALTVLTGASRGLGTALAEQLLEPGATLLCLSPPSTRPSRHSPASAARARAVADRPRRHGPGGRARRGLAARRDGDRYDSATLINNAALLPAIAPPRGGRRSGAVPRCASDSGAVAAHIRFPARDAPLARAPRRPLQGAQHRPGSGARRWRARPTTAPSRPGWTTCRAPSPSSNSAPHPARNRLLLAPGVIDTGMQEPCAAPAEQFPDRARFVQLQAAGPAGLNGERRRQGAGLPPPAKRLRRPADRRCARCLGASSASPASSSH